MTPLRRELLAAALGVLLGFALSGIVVSHAASRSASQPGVPLASSTVRAGAQSGAPLGTSRNHPKLSDPLDGSRLGAGDEDRSPASGAPSSPAGRTETSERLIPMPAPWHHDPEISFFGPGLYGRRTACGLALTTRLIGVAHRSLPCGTLVEFRWRGRTLTVPVVDRGPYWPGRQWDLTGGACVALRHCWTGPIEWRLP